MGIARLIISYGACPWMACTVRGHESVIQKYLNSSAVPLHLVKRRHDSFGNTPCVTYALTDSAPCVQTKLYLSRENKAPDHFYMLNKNFTHRTSICTTARRPLQPWCLHSMFILSKQDRS